MEKVLQIGESSDISFTLKAIDGSEIDPKSEDTVSYTHLDVYKRQVTFPLENKKQ